MMNSYKPGTVISNKLYAIFVVGEDGWARLVIHARDYPGQKPVFRNHNWADFNTDYYQLPEWFQNTFFIVPNIDPEKALALLDYVEKRRPRAALVHSNG